MQHSWTQKLTKIVVLLTGSMAFSCAQAQAVRWEPVFRFPDTFFPAFAVSAAGRDSRGPTDTSQAYGFLDSGQFGVKFLEAPAGSKLKIQVEVLEIGVSGEIEAPAPTEGKPKLIMPRLSCNQHQLTTIDQPVSAEAVFRVYVDGTLAGEERRSVRVRATNDTPLQSCLTPQQCTDYSPYMAAFVNEDSPVIDHILREALDIPAMPVKQWTGTQVSEEEVLNQVWAIWYLLQRNKMTYSSITTTSDVRQDLTSQTVRPLSQALSTQQANCVDGTVLFASILRKIGIEPLIVLVPGHAFLGFFPDTQHRRPVFLETTMLNGASNPFYQRGPTKTGMALGKMLGTDVHMQKSWQSFVEALNEGQRKYILAAPNFGNQRGFWIVPVMKARELGILPLPL